MCQTPTAMDMTLLTADQTTINVIVSRLRAFDADATSIYAVQGPSYDT